MITKKCIRYIDNHRKDTIERQSLVTQRSKNASLKRSTSESGPSVGLKRMKASPLPYLPHSTIDRVFSSSESTIELLTNEQGSETTAADDLRKSEELSNTGMARFLGASAVTVWIGDEAVPCDHFSLANIHTSSYLIELLESRLEEELNGRQISRILVRPIDSWGTRSLPHCVHK